MSREGGEWRSERQEREAWKKLRTGARSDYHSIKRDERGFPLFVPGTSASDHWDPPHREGQNTLGSDLDGGSALPNHSNSDIFPEAMKSSGTTTLTLPSAVVDTETEIGTTAASFYSQLPREEIDTTPAGINDAVRETQRGAADETSSGRSRVPPGSERHWFIRKASARLGRQEWPQKSDEKMWPATLVSVADDLTGRCMSCSAQLPIPLDVGKWDAHRQSIAHQVATNESVERPRSSVRSGQKRKFAEDKEDASSGRIVLKPTNPGYSALQRMGWRKGMGLGRLEWEIVRTSADMDSGNGDVLSEAGVHEPETIVISDSEGEDSDLEVGSDAWFIRAESRKEAAHCGRHILDVAAGEFADKADSGVIDSITVHAMRERPLLEPIPVHLRPDRRGIGKALPASSRVSDNPADKRPTSTKAREEQRQRQKMTKAERRAKFRHDAEEWKQLRSSLN